MTRHASIDFILIIISIHESADNGLDLGKRAHRVEPLPELRRAGTPVEVTEKVNVHLHGRKPVRRRDVVVRVFTRKDVPELKKILEVSAEIVEARSRSRTAVVSFSL